MDIFDLAFGYWQRKVLQSEGMAEIADSLVLDGYLDIIFYPTHDYCITDDGNDWLTDIDAFGTRAASAESAES